MPRSQAKHHLQIAIFHSQPISLLAHFCLHLPTPHSENKDKHTENLAKQDQIV